MYSGAFCSGVFYFPKESARLARPSATEVLSVVSVEPVLPVVSSSIAPLPVGDVSSMEGTVGMVVGAVEGVVAGMVGTVVGIPVGVVMASLLELVHPQPVKTAAVRTSVNARIKSFFIT